MLMVGLVVVVTVCSCGRGRGNGWKSRTAPAGRDRKEFF